MKKGWTGLESAGKSQLMAVEAVFVLKRNIRWLKKREKLGLPSIPRIMAFDSPMSESFKKRVELAGLKYIHFYDFNDIMPLSNIDIFINEINKFFPSRGSEPLTREQAEFLSQGAKDGVDIYFCSQDFSQAHKGFRFLVNEMYHVTKWIGSRRPVPSAPPVRYVWGIVTYRQINPATFKGDNMTMEVMGLPSVYLINRGDTELYDTSYKVRGSSLPPVRLFQQIHEYVGNTGEVLKTEIKWAKK